MMPKCPRSMSRLPSISSSRTARRQVAARMLREAPEESTVGEACRASVKLSGRRARGAEEAINSRAGHPLEESQGEDLAEDRPNGRSKVEAMLTQQLMRQRQDLQPRSCTLQKSAPRTLPFSKSSNSSPRRR